MNPLTLVYERLYTMAVENNILGQYVKPGNMIRLDDKGNEKKSVSTADYPELILTQTSMLGNLHATSNRTQFEITYNWLLTTGSWDLENTTADLTWGLLTASAVWCTDLTSLRWEDRSFVTNVELGAVEVTVLDTERNRGVQGWTLVWPLLVDMNFETKALRGYQWESTPASSGQLMG